MLTFVISFMFSLFFYGSVTVLGPGSINRYLQNLWASDQVFSTGSFLVSVCPDSIDHVWADFGRMKENIPCKEQNRWNTVVKIQYGIIWQQFNISFSAFICIDLFIKISRNVSFSDKVAEKVWISVFHFHLVKLEPLKYWRLPPEAKSRKSGFSFLFTVLYQCRCKDLLNHTFIYGGN